MYIGCGYYMQNICLFIRIVRHYVLVEQPDCSSPQFHKLDSLKSGEHGNCDATEVIVTTEKSFSTSHQCGDTLERDAGELPAVEKASLNGCGPQRNSHASEGSGNEFGNCPNKQCISPSVKLDAENGFNLVSSEASVTRECSSAQGNDSPVLNKSIEEITDSQSKDNFKNPSGHMVKQTNLTRPIITFNRCYKRKKCLDVTDRQSKLLHEKENISALTKWSKLVNVNACSTDESSCEEGPVGNVPDLNQSVDHSERGKPLNQTQDEGCSRSCSTVFLTDLNQSAEPSERGELYQTREKVWLSGDFLKPYGLLL